MTSENQGYALSVTRVSDSQTAGKVFLRPMALYVPDVAAQAVAGLISDMSDSRESDFVLTVTNNNNGVSVDKDPLSLAELNNPAIAADAVKELINIVRGYESDEETNVCGW